MLRLYTAAIIYAYFSRPTICYHYAIHTTRHAIIRPLAPCRCQRERLICLFYAERYVTPHCCPFFTFFFFFFFFHDITLITLLRAQHATLLFRLRHIASDAMRYYGAFR